MRPRPPTVVHYVGPWAGEAYCGKEWVFCSPIRADVTCPKCKERLAARAPGLST